MNIKVLITVCNIRSIMNIVTMFIMAYKFVIVKVLFVFFLKKIYNRSMKKEFQTQEVCQMFNISRSTLFRMEKEKILGEVERDVSGDRRIYKLDNLNKIREIKLSKQYNTAAKADDDKKMKKVLEIDALYRAIYFDDDSGFSELLEMKDLSLGTKKLLIDFASSIISRDFGFYLRIIKLLFELEYLGKDE
jgi:hypothetical protein